MDSIISIQQQRGGGVQEVSEFANNDIQATWIPVFIFFITWLLGLIFLPLIHPLSGGRKFPGGGAGQSTTEAGGLESGAAVSSTAAMGGAGKDSTWSRRLGNFTRAARDSLLILLATTLVNMAGHGITGGVVVLSWIVFAILAVWTLSYLFFNWKTVWWLEMLMLFAVGVLQVINFSLAFRNAQ